MGVPTAESRINQSKNAILAKSKSASLNLDHTLSMSQHIRPSILTVVLSLFFFGCGTRGGEQKVLPVPSSREAPANVQVDIVIDATPSVAGWVDTEAFKGLIMNDLDAPLDASWETTYAMSKILNAESVANYVSKSEAVTRSYYSRGDTDIGAIIAESKESHVTVIATDLFQTDQASSDVSRELSRLVSDSTLVYVLARDMPFDGHIFDVGFSKKTFAYSGDRPLYLLVMGPTESTSAYIENLLKNYHWDLAIGWRSDASREGWEIESIVSQPGGGQAFTNKSKRDQEATLILNSKNRSDGGSVITLRCDYCAQQKYDNSRRTVHIARVEHANGEGSPFKRQIIKSLNESAEISEGNELNFVLYGSDAWNLSAGEDYKIVLHVMRTYKRLPPWVENRSIELPDLDQLFQDGEYDGKKTLGLRSLIERVSNRSEATQEPLATIHISIKLD